MKPSTAENLLHMAADLDLVATGELHAVFREAGGHALSAEEFGLALVRRELLTGFQLERLLRGERKGYFYGPAKILYQTGAGTFARVYRGINRDTGAIVAVKVLRARYSHDPDKCRAFQHEGEMGRLLRHPNIVAIEDVGQEGGAIYITLEFVEGQTLRELVRIRGALDLPKALELIQHMASGLEYAHRRGVTHRDLKASNVIISATGQAKLVDFGLAGVDDSGDKSLGRVDKPRTLDYLALEKLSGVREDSVRSDIYFLGTIAYLALAGVSPLTESRDRSVRADPRRFTTVEPLATRAPQLPRDVVECVARMMHLDPLERWQTASDVRRAVEGLIARRAGGGSTAAARSPGEQAVTWKGSLMLVESGEKPQQALREFFTKLGYRVLMTENPQRALSRFSTVPPPADCLVLSAHTLGQSAVDAFNSLATDPYLADVPALLLAGPKQAAITGAARVDGRRRVLELPAQPDTVSRAIADVCRR